MGMTAGLTLVASQENVRYSLVEKGKSEAGEWECQSTTTKSGFF